MHPEDVLYIHGWAPVTFYDPNTPELSLLHLIFNELPEWKIGHVDYILRDKVCSVEIWVELFGGDIKNFHRGSAMEINEILRRLEGWESLKEGQGKLRFGKFYGTQRAFLRKN